MNKINITNCRNIHSSFITRNRLYDYFTLISHQNSHFFHFFTRCARCWLCLQFWCFLPNDCSIETENLYLSFRGCRCFKPIELRCFFLASIVYEYNLYVKKRWLLSLNIIFQSKCCFSCSFLRFRMFKSKTIFVDCLVCNVVNDYNIR